MNALEFILLKAKSGEISRPEAVSLIEQFKTGDLPLSKLSGYGYSGDDVPADKPDYQVNSLTSLWQRCADSAVTSNMQKNKVDDAFLRDIAPNYLVIFSDDDSPAYAESLELLPEAQRLSTKDIVKGNGLESCDFTRVRYVLWLSPKRQNAPLDHELVEQQQFGLYACFDVLKALLAQSIHERHLNWLLLTNNTQSLDGTDSLDPTDAGLHGLLSCAVKEQPQWRLTLVDLHDYRTELLHDIIALQTGGEPVDWVYKNNSWYEKSLIPVIYNEAATTNCNAVNSAYTHNGVYVVIGGAGGLGQVWTQYMIENFDAQIYWLGRRAHDDTINAAIARLAKLGKAPVYLQCDASSQTELQRAAQQISERCGSKKIHGVINSTLTDFDKSVVDMSRETFISGTQAKINVSVNMVACFQPYTPDFLLFFASFASHSRDHGKASYVAGNVFVDAYVKALNRNIGSTVKVINWGLWDEVGSAATIPEASKKRMKNAGFIGLTATEAMTQLERAMVAPVDQVAVIKVQRSTFQGNYQAQQVIYESVGDSGILTDVLSRWDVPEVDALHQVLADEGYRPLDKADDLILRSVAHIFQHWMTCKSLTWKQLSASLLPKYALWFQETERLLLHNGLLSNAANPVITAPETLLETIKQEWQNLLEDFYGNEDQSAKLNLVLNTLLELPAILRGEVEATTIIFPRSSTASVEKVYKGDKVADFYNSAIAQLVKNRIDCAGVNGEALKVLEVGAGTGGTTHAVLHMLAARRQKLAEYNFTDLSRAFLIDAQQKYSAEFPFVSYNIFDVSKDPEQQGIATNEYDIVVATNVLHATPNIGVTLANIKRTLKKGGLLLINEVITQNLVAHMTFGLLDGWWMAEDSELRMSGSPILSCESWQAVLQQQGFGKVTFPTRNALDFGQQVIISESDGFCLTSLDGHSSSGVAAPKANIDKARKARAVSPFNNSGLQQTQHLVNKILARVLHIGIDQINNDDAFEAYGIDSILTLKIVDECCRAGLVVDASLFYKCKTPRELASYCFDKFGDQISVQQTTNSNSRDDSDLSADSKSSITRGQIVEHCIFEMRGALAEVLQISKNDILPEESFENYGIDSILITRFADSLRTWFPAIDVSMLYKCGNLRILVDTLAETWPELMQEMYAADGVKESSEALSARVAKNRVSKSSDTQQCSNTSATEIAIIGMHGRFPGASDLQQFWENLRAGVCSIDEIPAERWDYNLFFEADRNLASISGKSYSKWGGFLDGFNEFDPLFFNMTPRDALNIDPQERLFIQSCWSVLEDAGYTRARLAAQHHSRVGVFAGVTRPGFNLYLHNAEQYAEPFFPQTSFSSVANRVSWLMNFSGPSMPVDTMCSSSLTAIHEACEHIQRGSCELAIAGGVNLYLHPTSYIGFCATQMLSASSECKSFGAGADGFVPGEGVASVLLKSLQMARRDGDQIHAVIVGSATNHGGKTNGYTVPNPDAQRDLIGSALQKAQLSPADINYVEAHGTGTHLGDPIEIRGLTEAFAGADRVQRCVIGTVKPNIGHLEAAAGIAGVIKVILQMKHQSLVPSLNADTVNPHIKLNDTPFALQRETAPWNTPSLDGDARAPRIAGVSSFGAGGANAHIILREPAFDEIAALPSQRDVNLILLSARDRDDLQALAGNLSHALQSGQFSDNDLDSIAHTLQVGREAMAWRLAILTRSLDELNSQLNSFIDGATDKFGLFCGCSQDHKSTLGLLSKDDNTTDLLKAWYREGKYTQLLDFWVKGLDIAWSELIEQPHPRPVSLPSYPFKKEKYWLPAKQNQSEVSHAKLPSENAGDTATSVMLYQTVYQPVETAEVRADRRHDAVIVFIEAPSAEFEKLQRTSKAAHHLYNLTSHAQSPAKRYLDYTQQLVKIIQSLATDFSGEVQLQVISCCSDEFAQLQRGLSALLRSLTTETPRIATQYIECDVAMNCDAQVLDNLISRKSSANEPLLRYTAQGYLRETWQALPAGDESADALRSPWRNSGVYLISGGLGGLGRVFLEEINRCTESATVYVLSRSSGGDVHAAFIEKLRATGTEVAVVACDISELVGLQSCVDKIISTHGRVDGVIQAAGVLRDGFLLAKQSHSIADVYAAKVQGTQNLDAVTAHLKLDFFALFSSCAGQLGSVAQSDYAAANRFMDEYAQYRQSLVAQGKRQGTSVAINWPKWETAGMSLSGEVAATYQEVGLRALSPQQGVELFQRCLSLGVSQVLVLCGDAQLLQKNLTASIHGIADDRQTATPRPELAQIEPDGDLVNRVAKELCRLMGRVINMAEDKIDPENALENYGLDSIVVNELNTHLGMVFSGLSKTILYEYKTLNGVAAGLVEQRYQECLAWVGQAVQAPVAAAGKSEVCTAASNQKGDAIAPLRHHDVQTNNIAIIGMTGRFPEADNLQEFWNNLQAGRNCISEWPQDRFPLENLFEGDVKKAVREGKSYSRWGGFISDFYYFDPLLFGMSYHEAKIIDPQERLFIQSCWETFEDAGYSKARMQQQHNGAVGVFAGITKTGFELHGPTYWQAGESFEASTSFASVANRISYIFDLNGPSQALDTMCSSSLYAVHAACESLRLGRCEMAIAGGVNLYLHPANYVLLCANTMLSRDGLCRSFGEGGDGFVPGEGVASVLLKPLREAQRDNDNIHAVIRGSSVNHGGHTTGYTVPNPLAQANLIVQALDDANVSADEISYIEAHGTGTSLGDPIEISGLTKAFARRGGSLSTCAIGSVKSNIGHLEACAGIAGLVKVVLQMQHQILVPSLNAATINPNIDFSETPFLLNRELQAWLPSAESESSARMAGVSSFGAGGSNAHVILEEYCSERNAASPGHAGGKSNPALIVISARSQHQVQRIAANLYNHLQVTDATPSLEQIAFTLQLGREAQKYRIALTADSLDELKNRLFVIANVDMHAQNTNLNDVLEDSKALQQRLEENSLETLAAAAQDWLSGKTVDWMRFYDGDSLPGAVSLPTYPFEKEKFWLDAAPCRSNAGATSIAQHPFVNELPREGSTQRFSTRFTGDEYFFQQHQVGGKGLLAGSTLVEIVAAALQSAGRNIPFEIRNLVWPRALHADAGNLALVTELEWQENNGGRFRIVDSNNSDTTYCKGLIRILVDNSEPLPEVLQQPLDGQSSIMSDSFYSALDTVGVAYGAKFRCLQTLHVVDGGIKAVLENQETEQYHYCLPPALLDAVLHSCFGLTLAGDQGGKAAPGMAFSIQSLRIYQALIDGIVHAYVRQSSKQADNATLNRYDIHVADGQGRCLLAIEGFTTKQRQAPQQQEQLVSLVPHWQQQPDINVQQSQQQSLQVLVCYTQEYEEGDVSALLEAYAATLNAPVMLCVSHDWCDDDLLKLLSDGNFQKIVWLTGHPAAHCSPVNARGEVALPHRAEEVLPRQDSTLVFGFRLIKLLAQLGYKDRALDWSLISYNAIKIMANDVPDPYLSGLHGLLGCMVKEYPNWRASLVDLNGDRVPQPEYLLNLEPDNRGDTLAYRQGRWYRQALIPAVVDNPSGSLLKLGGVYVILGGAGGIGEVLSRYLIEEYNAKVIWLGRRSFDSTIQKKRDTLAEVGEAPFYIPCDISNIESLCEARAKIRDKWGKVNGIFHSALGDFDRSIDDTSVDAFRGGLAAKVAGSVNLAQAWVDEPLDFISYFSALAVSGRDQGKCSYVAGGAFEEAFAGLLNHYTSFPVRVVSWGFWGDVGSAGRVSDAFRARLKGKGIGVISEAEGMAAIERLLVGSYPHLVVQKLLVKPEQSQQVPVYIKQLPQTVESQFENLVDKCTVREIPMSLKQVASENSRIDWLTPILEDLTLAQLVSMKVLSKRATRTTDVAAKLPQKYQRWLYETLRVLAAQNKLEYDRETVRVADGVATDLLALWDHWEQKIQSLSEPFSQKHSLSLVEAMVRALPVILSGEKPATDIMFPKSNVDNVGEIYQGNHIPDFFNGIVADTIAQYGAANQGNGGLKILEVGAGTGGTSAIVFKAIQDRNVQVEQYVYTDISKAFLIHAEEKYTDIAPYMETARFDIEKPPGSQNIPEGAFDIVLATNVLHATSDMMTTLTNLKALLKTNGVVLIHEMCGNTLVNHLTFGLLEGWWLYEDENIREQGTPGISPANWSALLQACGFKAVSCLSDVALQFGQQVILAESDGCVVQPMAPVEESLNSQNRKLPEYRSSQPASSPIAMAPQFDVIIEQLKGISARVLKVPREKMDIHEALESYGLDSIFAVKMADEISQEFIEVESTLLYEHQSLSALANYLATIMGDAELTDVAPDFMAETGTQPPQGEEDLREAAIAFFRQLVARVLKMEPGKLDPSEALENYGIDSILAVKLADEIENFFEDIDSTLFFEHQNVAALVDFLIVNQTDNLAACVFADTVEGSRVIPSVNASLASTSNTTTNPDISPNATNAHNTATKVAVIGMNGRFPQADNLEEYWQNLLHGKDCIEEIPESRWSMAEHFESDKNLAIKHSKSYAKWCGFINGYNEFDPLFFNISPKDALSIDPQERLFIASCWHTLEDAGYTRALIKKRFNSRVGVYAGITKTGYELYGPDLWRNQQPLFPMTSFGSVANRVSYLMGFHGPSMPVDTMCSSSLTAIHLACDHLLRSECDLAIAGGVNVYAHASSYLRLAANQMLSTDGKCRSFGDGGDGFVPGEGVASILLKRLEDAIADNDNIHAVICGTKINHGGKTNGYTVPNPSQQRDVIRGALDNANVSAEQLTYIEAHGTGTALGDPIEISGLTQAFKSDTLQTAFCAIGSAKSNIGHLEAAAGIAGVIKVILQLKHKILVPTLHAQQTNKKIAFEKTPFYLQQHASPWELTDDRKKRMAGVSSFGAGGANAHVVIEEYLAPEALAAPEVCHSRGRLCLIPLSAKSEKQLREYLTNLVTFLDHASNTNIDLVNLAYTLQVGREQFSHRVVLLVESIAALSQELQCYLNGDEHASNVYRGSMRDCDSSLALFGSDDDLVDALKSWAVKGKFAKLAEIWVQGANIAWEDIFQYENSSATLPRRISLPVYPFKREVYWAPKVAPVNASAPELTASSSAYKGIMLTNVSDLTGLQYRAVFRADEFFIKGHLIDDTPIVPAVVYLELAISAARLSLGKALADHEILELMDITWISPACVTESTLALTVAIIPEGSRQLAFKIVGEDGVCHCQGRIQTCAKTCATRLDIPEVTQNFRLSAYDYDALYRYFSRAKLKYGEEMRGIRRVYHCGNEIMAQLDFSDCVTHETSGFSLHPGVLDSALQACAALMFNNDQTDFTIRDDSPLRPGLPFTLTSLRCYSQCSSHKYWSKVTLAPEAQSTQAMNIHLLDEAGKLIVEMSGFTTKPRGLASIPGAATSSPISKAIPLQDANHSDPFNAADTMNHYYLKPVWEVANIYTEGSDLQLADTPLAQPQCQLLFFLPGAERLLPAVCGHPATPGMHRVKLTSDIKSQQILEVIKDHASELTTITVALLPSESKTTASQSHRHAQQQGVLFLFELAKCLITLGFDSRKLVLNVLTRNTAKVRKQDPFVASFASVPGFVGSLAKEIKLWEIKHLDLPESPERLTHSDINLLVNDGDGTTQALRDGLVYKQRIVPFTTQAYKTDCYRESGVYVVIGGAGGVGSAWSEYVATHYNAQVIWVGRRAFDAEIRARISHIEKQGGKPPVYYRVDATKEDEMIAFVAQCKTRFGTIHGVVHSAIVLDDKSVANMERATFEAVLAAKVDTCTSMAQAFSDEDLDFVLFFSAIQSFAKAPGQSNYAAGCTFADTFALQLSEQWHCDVKVMNWGYWGSVGIVAKEAYRNSMALRGIGSIEANEAMAALNLLMNSDAKQLVFIKGTEAYAKSNFLGADEIIQLADVGVPEFDLDCIN